ncbi:hypothetical protein LCGC14_2542850, partial [marine sediment metagenome]
APEDRAMVQQTIRALNELRRLQSSRRIEREAEIIRTVKDLSPGPIAKTKQEGG